MKRALTLLLALAAAAHAQFAVMHTNGVVTSPTNLVWGNAFGFSSNAVAAQVRTNLGLGAASSPSFAGLVVNGNASLLGHTHSYSAVIGEDQDGFLHIATLNQEEIQIGWGGTAEFNDYELAATLDQARWSFHKPFAIPDTTNRAITRTNLGLGLPALTNTSNVTLMRALSGSTNTNHPFSGNVSVGTNTLVFSNGILLNVQ